MQRPDEDVASVANIEEQSVNRAALDQGWYLGDALDFFLRSKRSGGRSEKTVEDYRKKLELFQSYVARRISDNDDEPEVDAPLSTVDADMVEQYIVYLKDTKKMADSSRKNYLAVLRTN